VAKSTDWHVSGWLAVLLLPILLPVGLILQLLPFKKTRDRSPPEVAGFLRDFIQGQGGEWDWDDFESVPITDPKLDRIRREGARAGPPNPDLGKMADLLHQAEALIYANPH